jgi:hypothetical protein
LGEAADFFSVGGLPQGTFAGFRQLGIFGDLTRVGIKGVAVEGVVGLDYCLDR